MAKPADFELANTIWLPPAGVSEKDCGTLPAHICNHGSFTAWRLSKEEIAEVANTGIVWVQVLGQQPMMSVSGIPLLAREDGAPVAIMPEEPPLPSHK